MSNLSFSVLLAPYRVEYYNYIYKNLNCECYFQNKNFSDHLFTEEQVLSRCEFTPKYIKVKKIFWGRNIAWNLISIIKKDRPKFIIAPEFSFITLQLIILKFIFKYKLVVKSDDSYAMIQYGGFSRIHAVARKLFMPFVDEIILCDKRTVGWYQKKYKKGIWLPIIQDERNILSNDVARYNKISESYIEKYGLQGLKTILFVGRLVEVKNVSLLIESCSHLQIPYKLVIVGDGLMKRELENLAMKLHVNALFTGLRNGDELYAWYRTADLFVLPSTKEAFGAVTNEALLNGCYCLISERAGSSCLIDDGKNGYIFSVDRKGDLKEKMVVALGLPVSYERNSKMEKNFEEYMQNAFGHMFETLNIQC